MSLEDEVPIKIKKDIATCVATGNMVYRTYEAAICVYAFGMHCNHYRTQKTEYGIEAFCGLHPKLEDHEW